VIAVMPQKPKASIDSFSVLIFAFLRTAVPQKQETPVIRRSD
jgi:hypothetical protein